MGKRERKKGGKSEGLREWRKGGGIRVFAP